MAFVKKTWKDRIAEFPTRRRLTKEDNTSELVTVAREEGTLSQEGDAFSAENMNDLENRIDAEFTAVNGKLNNISFNVSGYESGINISNYTESNPYILPKSGLVTAASVTSNQSYKAVIGIVETGAVASATYPIACSLYLPKGTKVYNRAYEGTKWSSTPASFSYLLFYAEK